MTDKHANPPKADPRYPEPEAERAARKRRVIFSDGQRLGFADGSKGGDYLPHSNPYLTAAGKPKANRSVEADCWAGGYVAGWDYALDSA